MRYGGRGGGRRRRAGLSSSRATRDKHEGCV